MCRNLAVSGVCLNCALLSTAGSALSASLPNICMIQNESVNLRESKVVLDSLLEYHPEIKMLD